MSPAAALLEELARARRAGLPFEQAWGEALPVALAQVADRQERASWAAVLGSMVETWRGAWERRPATSRERALLTVAEREDGIPLPDRACERCGEAIPPDAPGRTLYCSAACRREASEERLRTAA